MKEKMNRSDQGLGQKETFDRAFFISRGQLFEIAGIGMIH